MGMRVLCRAAAERAREEAAARERRAVSLQLPVIADPLRATQAILRQQEGGYKALNAIFYTFSEPHSKGVAWRFVYIMV